MRKKTRFHVSKLVSRDTSIVVLCSQLTNDGARDTFSGSGADIVSRVVLAVFAVMLLDVEWLKIIGALLVSEDEPAGITGRSSRPAARAV